MKTDFLGILFLVFLVLKLTNCISWSWLIVLTPLWTWLLLVIICIVWACNKKNKAINKSQKR